MSESARYYRVSPRFWTRAQQKGWSDDVKLLALYLMTGPHRATEGLYRLPRKYAEADLEWSPQRFDQRLRELVADGFCSYDDDAQVVLIHKAMSYQATANDNMVKATLKRLAELPETPLTCEFVRLAEQYDERLAKRLPEGFGNPSTRTEASTSALEESPPDDGEDDEREAQVVEAFEQWWTEYPDRNGKKNGKGRALIEWRKLSLAERRRAYLGAVNLARSDQLPKDPERFLRTDKAGEFPFDDWQTPATPSANGQPDYAAALAQLEE